MGELNIAFAGHNRPEDLGDIGAIEQQLRDAFALFECTEGVLTTGLAQGADTCAASVWLETGRGEVHAVLPHLHDTVPDRLASRISKITWLDGGAAELGGRNAHLNQTRWVIEDADLLVAVWTGEVARGAGGTADAVGMALQRGIPVLWIKPHYAGGARLISPDSLDPDFGFLEFLELLRLAPDWLVQRADADALSNALRSARSISKLNESPGERHTWAGLSLDRVLNRTVWRTFAAYRYLVGGRGGVERRGPSIPEDLQMEPAFEALTSTYEEMDARANQLSAVHRSQQVFQASVMILAVAIGSAPAVWPQVKIYAVCTELVLAIVTFLVWWSAVRSARTRRWGEARRMAEQIRMERAAWAIGLSTRDDRRFTSSGPAAQFASACRRRVGGPTGAYDQARVKAWGGWALEELVYGQVAYHRVNGHLNHRLAHRGHATENVVFWVLVCVLTSYVITYGITHALHSEPPHWLGGIVILTGAITPAFGAASLALDAALAFSEQGRRSDAICRRLSEIADNIGDRPTLETLRKAARAAIRLQVSQEDNWSDDTAHRHVVRGG